MSENELHVNPLHVQHQIKFSTTTLRVPCTALIDFHTQIMQCDFLVACFTTGGQRIQMRWPVYSFACTVIKRRLTLRAQRVKVEYI